MRYFHPAPFIAVAAVVAFAAGPAAAHARLVSATPAPDSTVAGAYRVDWRIASSDGHRMTGSYAFTVR